MKNVLKSLAKNDLILLGLSSNSSISSRCSKKNFGSGMKTLIILNEEINDIMKIVKFLVEFGLLKRRVSETNNNEAKEQKFGFLGMLLGIIGASLLENILIYIEKIRAGEGTIRAGEGTIRADKHSLCCFIL